MRSKFSVILKIQQRWWCLVLKLNMLGKTPETHQFPRQTPDVLIEHFTAFQTSHPEASSLAICTTEMYLYVYGENVFFQYIFADAFPSPWTFFFFFNCTIMCSYSCLMLKRGEKLTMQPNSSQFQQLNKNINIWTALFFILPTKSDCCTSKELFAGLY